MAKRTDLDIDLMRASLIYDRATGEFRWAEFATAKGGRCGNYRNVPGSLAGGPHKSGYWQVGISGRKWLAHILAWAYVHGEIPLSDIDHINRNKRDNRIENLRLVTRAQNMRNIARHDDRGSSLGTTLTPQGWVAQVSHNSRTISLGTFPTQKAAHETHKEYVRTHGLEARHDA